jgi:hypothetical protein
MITALTAVGSAGTTIGLDASGALSPSSGPSAKQEQTLLNKQNQAAQQKQEQAAFRGAEPTTQAQTSGSLDNQSMSALIAQLTGAPADMNLAQQTIFGTQPELSTGG